MVLKNLGPPFKDGVDLLPPMSPEQLTWKKELKEREQERIKKGLQSSGKILEILKRRHKDGTL